MSRLSFRPRPLDIHKKLPIVKSVKDLDTDDGASVSRSVPHGHNALDADNELALSTPARRGGGSEIPTPEFVVVDSYERDYTRSFAQPPSYIRGRGGRSETVEYVEYDLDDEDEDWLLQLNNERKQLSSERFEWMLFKLEILDCKARERAGGMLTMLGFPTSVLLTRDAAIEVMRAQLSRFTVLVAVYDYWKAKRERWQKPILRRLQPPPPVNDTNPFNVFRPREKVHRPHTRRMQRRENDVQSFEKLRQVRRNLEQVRGLMRALQQREEKKRELVECEANSQRLHIKLKHDAVRLDSEEEGFMSGKFAYTDDSHPQGRLSSLLMGTADQANGVMRVYPAFELATPVTDSAFIGEQLDQLRRKRKPRRFPQPRGRPRKRITSMDSLEPVLLFTKPLDAEKLAAAGINHLENGNAAPPYRLHARFGRGGRIVFDRWDPLTRTPLSRSSNQFTPFPFAHPVNSIRVPRPARPSVVDSILNTSDTVDGLAEHHPPSTSEAPC